MPRVEKLGPLLSAHRDGKRKQRGARPSRKRVKIWQKLRQWKSRNQAYHNFGNVYQLSTLLGQVSANRVRPMQLDEMAILKPIRAQLLGWVVLACNIRRAYALCGTRAQWAELLHCHPNTFDAHRQALVDDGWLKLIADFAPHKGRGRNGEKINHRQAANWYAPGPRLREAFRRYEDQQLDKGQAQRLVEPKSDSAAFPTARSADQNCDPSLLAPKSSPDRTPTGARSESPLTASPSATSIDQKSPAAMEGAQGPQKESPPLASTHQQTTETLPAIRTAAPERPMGALTRENRARPMPTSTDGRSPHQSRPRPSDDLLSQIAASRLSVAEKRQLVAAYVRNPDLLAAGVRATLAGLR